MITYKKFLKINNTWLTMLYDTVMESYTSSFDIFSYNDSSEYKSVDLSEYPSVIPSPTPTIPKRSTRESTIEDLFDGINGDWRNDDEY